MSNAYEQMKVARGKKTTMPFLTPEPARGVVGLAAEFRSVLEDYTQAYDEEGGGSILIISHEDVESIVDDLVRKAIANGATE